MLSPESLPAELLVIREALAECGALEASADRLAGTLGERSEALSDRELRALGALALAKSDHPLWSTEPRDSNNDRTLRRRLADKLVDENSLLLDAWRAVFQPIHGALLDDLKRIYANRTEPEPRAAAFELLLAYANQPRNADRPEDIAALIGDSDPQRLNRLLVSLANATEADRAVAFLTPNLSPLARFDDALAARQGRIAVALARLGRWNTVWPLFRFRPDPSVRTELIHQCAPNDAPVAQIIERLKTESDMSIRRALVLCLGEYPPEQIPEDDREELARTLLRWYRSEPDAGLHGAVDWLFRVRWERADEIATINQEFASNVTPKDRMWFVNSQGQTYTIIRDPGEFRMGSSDETEVDRDIDEVQHRRLVPRSYAIAAREVTLAEWSRFLDANLHRVRKYGEDVSEEDDRPIVDLRDNARFRESVPHDACSVGVVPLYDAMRYCNWLSAQDGLPKHQWCYPESIGSEMTLPEDFLDRTGYRLPTEGEWEFACRAGTESSRPFGRRVERLGEYEWYQANAGAVMMPPGLLKPNELGLFDVLGQRVRMGRRRLRKLRRSRRRRAYRRARTAQRRQRAARRSRRFLQQLAPGRPFRGPLRRATNLHERRLWTSTGEDAAVMRARPSAHHGARIAR